MYQVRNVAMALKLVAREPAALGARLIVGDAGGAAQDRPVERESARALEELSP